MQAGPEGDLTIDIADIETFGSWMTRYRTSLLGDPNIKRSFDRVPAKSGIIGDVITFIDRYPWEAIPSSVQDIIVMQYEAALQPDEKKSVTIGIDPIHLEFVLNSPSVIGGVDEFSETYSRQGLRLYFEEEPPIGHLIIGKWGIDKLPPAIRARQRVISMRYKRGEKPSREEINSLMEIAMMNPVPVPATLPQLHDVARLLTEARPYAQVLEFVAQ